ncbi:hypothetical protein pb186bvf_001565 [Paramecium bursaria]
MKQISAQDLYNFIQDIRHLVIVDLRNQEQFEKQQIRGSLQIQGDPQLFLQKFSDYQKIAQKNEEKYKIMPIRRMVLVHDDPNLIQMQLQLIEELQKQMKVNYKTYTLSVSIQEFAQTYPFLILSKQQLDGYEQKQQNEFQNQVLFAHSLFPSELIKGQIYLGSVFNANSKQQLNALKIKSLIDLKFQEEEQQKNWQQEEFKYENYGIPQYGDYKVDFKTIVEAIKNAEKPLLIYCEDGFSLTSCVAAAYLMEMKGFKFDLATLKVFQIRGDTKVNKQIYQQILTYDPKQK